MRSARKAAILILAGTEAEKKSALPEKLRHCKCEAMLPHPGVTLKPCNPETKLVVLMVDDDRNDQALFALAVAETEFPIWVQSALDGRHAIHYLNGDGAFADRTLYPLPNLMLLDLKMGVADGFEFLDWRSKHPQFLSLPVILFTGSQYHRDIQRAMELGANAHVAKPLAFKDLLSTVEKIWSIGQNLSSRK